MLIQGLPFLLVPARAMADCDFHSPAPAKVLLPPTGGVGLLRLRASGAQRDKVPVRLTWQGSPGGTGRPFLWRTARPEKSRRLHWQKCAHAVRLVAKVRRACRAPWSGEGGSGPHGSGATEESYHRGKDRAGVVRSRPPGARRSVSRNSERQRVE